MANISIIELIKGLIKEVIPNYKFVYDSELMMNITADELVFPCVFFEEYTEGKIVDMKYCKYDETTIELSFMQLSELQGEALERASLRESIKSEAVLPLIRALEQNPHIEPINEYQLLPEPPRFDANCVSLLLRFTLRKKLCI